MDSIIAQLDAEHDPAAQAREGAKRAGKRADKQAGQATESGGRATAMATVKTWPGRPVPQKPMKKRKKVSGDARRRKKKARLAAAAAVAGGGGEREGEILAARGQLQTHSAAAVAKKKKKRHRTNAKCQCSRCGRKLKKKNLRGHLEHCDGTRPVHDPNHVKSEHKNGSTDIALEDMFKLHCEAKGLSGSPEDFAAWSENLLKNPEGVMKSVRDVSKTKKERQNMRNRERYADDTPVAAPPPMKQNATLTLDFAGAKKCFSSDDDEISSGEDE